MLTELCLKSDVFIFDIEFDVQWAGNWREDK